MLTEKDQQVFSETGNVTAERMRALRYALNRQADDARKAAAVHPEGAGSMAAAALRGKAVAYREAAVMVDAVAEGHALHPRSYSSSRYRGRHGEDMEQSETAHLLAGVVDPTPACGLDTWEFLSGHR